MPNWNYVCWGAYLGNSKKEKYIISTDLGSQSIKTAIYDEKGNSVTSYNQDSNIVILSDGSMVYDGMASFNQVIENIKNILSISKVNTNNIECLSFTGMGAGIIGIDEGWSPTTYFMNPLDKRSQSFLVKVINQYGDFIRLKSGIGNPAGVNYILWLKNKYPEVYKKTLKFLPLTHFVQGLLSGFKSSEAFWENTGVSFSGLYNALKDCWLEEFFSELKLNMNKMPRLVEPATIIGYLSKKSADLCGLKNGIPISTGAYDKVCDSLAANINKVGSAVDNAATYSALLVCVKDFKPDLKYKTLLCHRSAIKGLWLAQTYITGCGITHKWLIENFFENISKDEKNYMVLDKLASGTEPGSGKLFFIPHLGGQATPYDPFIKGSWVGINWSHKNKHFYRSFLESVAYENNYSLSIVKKNYPDIKFDKVCVIGGGSKSNIWNQIKADILGLDYILLNRDDLTTLGAALIGGKAIGLYQDLKDIAKECIQVKKVYQPNNDNKKIYRKYFKSYLELLRNLKNFYSYTEKFLF